MNKEIQALPNPFYKSEKRPLGNFPSPDTNEYFPTQSVPLVEMTYQAMRFGVKGDKYGENVFHALTRKIKEISLLLGGSGGAIDDWDQRFTTTINGVQETELALLNPEARGKQRKELLQVSFRNFRKLFRLQAEILMMDKLEQIAPQKLAPIKQANAQHYKEMCKAVSLLLEFLNTAVENYIHLKKEMYLGNFTKPGDTKNKVRNLRKAHKEEFGKVFTQEDEA
jgi:hypothetical protein